MSCDPTVLDVVVRELSLVALAIGAWVTARQDRIIWRLTLAMANRRRVVAALRREASDGQTKIDEIEDDLWRAIDTIESGRTDDGLDELLALTDRIGGVYRSPAEARFRRAA